MKTIDKANKCSKNYFKLLISPKIKELQASQACLSTWPQAKIKPLTNKKAKTSFKVAAPLTITAEMTSLTRLKTVSQTIIKRTFKNDWQRTSSTSICRKKRKDWKNWAHRPRLPRKMKTRSQTICMKMMSLRSRTAALGAKLLWNSQTSQRREPRN